MAGQTKRINRGRNHSYLLDGAKADGVTWIIGQGVPKPALIGWAGRTVAEAAVEQQDAWKDMAPGSAIEWLKQAPYSDRDKAANRGTQVHKFAEQLAGGAEIEVPDELVGHVDSYLKFREEWQPTDELTELVVINRKHRYMGTLDLIATIDGLGRVLVDIKTSRSGPFGEVALQLAGYRYAELYIDPQSGAEVPMPELDACYCLWVRADGFDLYPYEAGPEIFRQLLYAQQVAHFVNDRSKVVRGEAIFAAVGAPS